MEYVFVYGTLMEGMHNHAVLDNSEFLLETETWDSSFSLWDVGHFPAVKLNGVSKIKGELYQVPSLENLDSLEGFPELFTRIKVDIDHHTETAWMYIYNHKVSVFIESGDYRAYLDTLD